MKVKLTIFEADERVFDLTYENPVTLIVGRAPEADIQIRDKRISRQHCEIAISETDVRIRDLGSSNGIVFNKRKVKTMELRDRDSVRIGQSKISVAIGSRDRSTIVLPPTKDFDPSKLKCSECGKRISREDVLSKLAGQISGKMYCKHCFAVRKDPLIGKVISGYRIDSVVGAGATGKVYRATQVSMQRTIALKILKRDLTHDKKVVQKFLREARSCAELSHPNVMHVYNLGEEKGRYFIAMEYVAGKTVHDLINDKGRIPPLETIAITLQIARALDYAYTKKIVHRDIKPANVIVTPKGEAKLMDFGLAKNFEDSGRTGITYPGEGLGTPNYMPPEQVENALGADQRSDIYSLGASMYHMLTGKYPLEDPTIHGLLKKILLEDPTPVHEVNKEVPAYVSKIVEKAMCKNPDGRYQVPGEMIKELTEALHKLKKTRRASKRLPKQ